MPRKRAGKSSKRTVLEPHKGDRRYVRRNKAGELKRGQHRKFAHGKSARRKPKSKVANGQGNRGDSK
jgi:hypothetical protein